jgi:hypothetical protein
LPFLLFEMAAQQCVDLLCGQHPLYSGFHVRLAGAAAPWIARLPALKPRVLGRPTIANFVAAADILHAFGVGLFAFCHRGISFKLRCARCRRAFRVRPQRAGSSHFQVLGCGVADWACQLAPIAGIYPAWAEAVNGNVRKSRSPLAQAWGRQ